MNNLIKVLEDGQLVVTSRQVAEDFEKRNGDVLAKIDSLILEMNSTEKSVQYFISSQYKDNSGKSNREYLLTRDGFSLLVMGFTGQKALQWKLKYIEAFNKMEQVLKQQQKPQCIEDVLIQSLQEMKDIKQQLNQVNHNALQANAKAEETGKEVQAMRDVISLNPNSWRTDAKDIIVKIAQKLGGNSYIRDVNKEVYTLLNTRMGVNLEQRLTNKRRRMADEGVCKSKRDKLNKLDVIADDKKLIEGYVSIVKEMAIKYSIA